MLEYFAGIILALFFLLDIYHSEKNKKGFIYRLIIIILTTIPLFIDSISGVDKYSLYSSFFASLVIGTSLIYIYFFNISRKYNLQIMDCIFEGHVKINKKINKYKSNLKEEKVKYDESILKVHNVVKKNLPLFVNSMYRDSIEYDKFTDYVVYVFEDFIDTFFAKVHASFTLREIDDTKKNMIAIATTRESMPSNIPLNSNNLISFSAKDKEAKIYSRCKEKHFCTNKSIKNGIYDDYVTYCLFTTKDGTPAMSINFDVAGEEAVNKMRALVDTSIFDIIYFAMNNYLDIKRLNNV